MSVPMAYVAVILIWSTTPLAVYWSSVEAGFIFGATSRMLIGAVLATMAAALLGSGLKWHRRAVLAYLLGGFGFFAGMMTVYWAAQYVPTGWISLIYGLMPIITAVMAHIWLEGEVLSAHRVIGMLIGIAGLAVIFGSGFMLSVETVLGIAGVLISASIHAGVSVAIKRLDLDLPAISMTSGGLLFAAPFYLLALYLSPAPLPTHLEPKTLAAIGYLSLFGSVFGFALYYYVLKNVEATRTALITLISPVLALTLGNIFNGEVITPMIVAGALLILSGLALFEVGGKIKLQRS